MSNSFTTVDTLVRESVPVNFQPVYVYSSIPNLPHGLPIAFDGVLQHRFQVSGTAAFPALLDSVQSVALPVVTSPAAAAGVHRNADLAVTWSDAGTDSTIYVQCVVRSDADTTRLAWGQLVRDAAGATIVTTAQLSGLAAGSARLSVGRYRLLHHLNGSHKVNLVCEATELRAVTLQ